MAKSKGEEPGGKAEEKRPGAPVEKESQPPAPPAKSDESPEQTAGQGDQTGPLPQNPPEPPKEPSGKKVTRVRVILKKGVLGGKRLTLGQETDDPEYVALLDTERGRRLVKAVD